MFKIDVEICEHCGGAVTVIANIEDLIVTKKPSSTSIGAPSPRPQPSDPSRGRRRKWRYRA